MDQEAPLRGLPGEDAAGRAWPPKWMGPALLRMQEHDALYIGTPELLSGVYSDGSPQMVARQSQYAGGIVGWASRMWWGRPVDRSKRSMARLHLPLPSDIATASADQLFSEAPRIVIPDASEVADVEAERQALDAGERPKRVKETAEQQLLERVVNTPATHTVLLEAGELAAALGGAYLRLVVDTVALDHVEVEAVDADAAVPEFRHGRLVAVTFWQVVEREKKGAVWRWLERHEPGMIAHALYLGTEDRLGVRVPLDRQPATEWLARAITDGRQRAQGATRGAIRWEEDDQAAVLRIPGLTGLTAEYAPNMRPNREFRRDPMLRDFGRSDFAGIEQAFDAIDEAFSSWLRDIRLGKGRIIVPEEYLDNLGAGRGSAWDSERDVYDGVKMLSNDPANTFQLRQFEIRAEVHERSIAEWTRWALRSAGWSPGTLGEAGARSMRTATEVAADEKQSERTRDKKANYWREALTRLVRTWVELQVAVYGDGPEGSVQLARFVEPVEVRFPAQAQQDMEVAARIATMLRGAKAASTMTLVRMLHPEWDGGTVNEEVERILQEQGGGAAEDPAEFRGDFVELVEQMNAASERELEEAEQAASAPGSRRPPAELAGQDEAAPAPRRRTRTRRGE